MFKALIVEDNDLFRLTLRRILTSEFPSIRIEEAVDGEEAFSIIKTLLPELIFMDIKLPGENGIQVTKKIKILYPKISIIIVTSYDSPEYREAASQVGAEYFISKRSSSTKDIIKAVGSLFSREVLAEPEKKKMNKGKRLLRHGISEVIMESNE